MSLNVVSSPAQTLCTPEKKRRHASGHELSSDGDSGESLFITQSAASKKVKRQKPAARSKSVSAKKSRKKKEECRPEDFMKKWHCLGDFVIAPKKQYTKPKRSAPRKHIRPIKGVFPFLLKSQKQQHLTLQKHQVLENSEIGGFFKCVKKMHESKGSPSMLEFVPSDDLDEDNSDQEVTVVNKAGFVLNKIKQKWLTQSILVRRLKDVEDKNLQNQSETLEVLCSDSELSDSDGSEQEYIIRLGDKESDFGHVWLVEETQRLTQALHEAGRMDTERGFLCLPQGGTQNHTQQSGTETLLPDEAKSEARKNHSITHKTAGLEIEETLLFMQNTDQDSDITEIDGETGEYVSKSGPGTPIQKGKSRAHSEAADKTTQRSSQTISTSSKVSSLVTGKQEENTDNNQCSDSQDASQSLLEPTSKKTKFKSPKKRRKISGTGVEVAAEDPVIDPASGPVERNAFPAVEMGDSPLFKPVALGFLRRKKKGKKTDTIQCETNVDASGNDHTGLETKHKDDERKSHKDNRTNEEQSCDTSRLSVGSDGSDILPLKKQKAKKQKLEERDDAEPSADTQNAQDSGSVSCKAKKKRKYDNATFNKSNEIMEDSSKPARRLSYSSRGEKTSEPLETSKVVASDSTTVKKKKMKTQDEESVETAQHNKSQTIMLSSKKTKKKKTERTTCEEETANVAENLEMRLNESIRPTEAHQPEDAQTTEETERCSSPGVTLLKSGKKKKKRNGSERPDVCPVFEEGASDVRKHLKSNTGDALNDAIRKKKRIVSQSVETPERRKKKNKGHSDGVIEDSSELQTNHEVSENSQSLMSTPSEIRPKKTKRKKNEEMKEADKSACPVSLAQDQTKETDSVIQENNAEKQVKCNSGVKIKKRKKDIEFTDNDVEMISNSQISQSDTPKRPKKERKKIRCDDEDTCAETVLQANKIKDGKKKCKQKGDGENVSAMADHSESQTDDVLLSKKKKRKSKLENVSVQDTQNSSIHSAAESFETLGQNDEEVPKIKKKKRKIIVNGQL